MIHRDELSNFLNDFLQCGQYIDYAPNGIQIEGKEQIHHICTAVTASAEVIRAAVDNNADALLVHHGYFWKGENPIIVGMKRQRIALMLAHQLNLYAYHLPLDCHIELGNNACLAKVFGANNLNMHTIKGTKNILWSGSLIESMTSTELGHMITKKLGRAPLHIAGKNTAIKSLAWCSGGAQDFIEDAVQLNVDAYISGEVSERTYYQAKELGIHYFACGHHATERYGIQALGEHLAKQFNLKHAFLDSNNPV